MVPAGGPPRKAVRRLPAARGTQCGLTYDNVFMNEREAVQYWEQNAEACTFLASRGCDVYRDLVNTPAFLDLLPDVLGLMSLMDMPEPERALREAVRIMKTG